jgi:uncharacterized protein YidB (DUF937 family)
LGPQGQELWARLRGLRQRAEAARRAAYRTSASDNSRKPWTQAALQEEVRASGLPGAEDFKGRRTSDWASTRQDRFKVPEPGSHDEVIALVKVWSCWARERADERLWRDQLDRAWDEHTAALRDSPVAAPLDGAVHETLRTVGASALEVHPALLPSGRAGVLPELTPYVIRRHDLELRQAMGSVLAGGPSVLVMLTGDSSTGKTRALYETVLELAADRPLLRPHAAEDLLDLIRSGGIAVGAVLWLNETQRFLYGQDGQRAAAELRRLLEQRPGVAAVGTLWQNPYWAELTDKGVSADPYSHARALLTSPVTLRITVPAELSADDQHRWQDLAEQRDDRRLVEALHAGEGSGQVVQHLSGGPELLTAYLAGPGEHFSHVEHAVITAALDARRLGHEAPIPAALLAAAADGSLGARHRPADTTWCERTLNALTTGQRPDGSRTDIRRTLTPLIALRNRSGSPAHYEPADYLDQHTRRRRTDQLGSAALWQALLDHTTDPHDLVRIADRAWDRGLYKHAVLLYRRAVLDGAPTASARLVARLATAGLDRHHHAADWVVLHAELANPRDVAKLLGALRKAGADEAVRTLLERGRVLQTNLGDTNAAYMLLSELFRAGEEEIARALARRAAEQVDATDTLSVKWLLYQLLEAGAEEAARTLACRAGEQADVSDANDVYELMDILRYFRIKDGTRALARRAGEHADPFTSKSAFNRLMIALYHEKEAMRTAACRAVAQIDVANAWAVCKVLYVLNRWHVEEAVRALLDRDPAARVDLSDAGGVAHLLDALREAGAEEAVRALLDRDPAAHADLSDAGGVAHLLDALRKECTEDAARLLVGRAVAEIDAPTPRAVTELLGALRRAGAEDAARLLVGRAVAEVDVSDARAVAKLLDALRESGAEEAVRALLDRDPAAHADLSDAGGVTYLLGALQRAGADDDMRALLDRDPAAHVDVSHSSDVEILLGWLFQEKGAVQTLARRAVAEVDVSDARAVAKLLDALRESGAEEAVRALLDRDPAAHADLSDTNARDVAALLGALSRLHADDAVQRLACRAVDAGIRTPDNLQHHGREINRRPAAPWTWLSLFP